MTVSYTFDVANGSSFGCFWKILGRWRGSVYKLIWRELFAYLGLYFAINLLYRYGLTTEQQHTFEKVSLYCGKQSESIPMSFVLGFYVSLIVKRWWEQHTFLPWVDSLAMFVGSSLEGQDERSRIMRRTIVRYAMLAYVLTMQGISFRVKKRFPTLQHLVDSGLMMENERKIFEAMEEKVQVAKYWVPLAWASTLVYRARKEDRIKSDHMVQSIISEITDIRFKLARVMSYDTLSVPLVYTQVVTLAVYTYFVAALIGKQWVQDHSGAAQQPDLYVPIFTTLQFAFYIGWLKVAETLINPFGEDDDDFELNWLIDRHIQVAYIIVDEMHEEHPELLRDQYFEEVIPAELPYTVGSEQYRRFEPRGSTAHMKIKDADALYADLAALKRNAVQVEEVYAEYESVDSPLVEDRKGWLQRQFSGLGSFRSTSSCNSSVFGRTRSFTPHNNSHHPNMSAGGGGGGTANAAQHPVTHHTGHRRSLYGRMFNRKPSKDHSRLSEHSGSRRSSKSGGLAMMARFRPRVPTPEVGKELDYPRTVANTQSSNQLPAFNQSHHQAMAKQQSSVESDQAKNAAALAAVLSPIAENDNSPYSTSSNDDSPKKERQHPTLESVFVTDGPPPLSTPPDFEAGYSTIEEEQARVEQLRDKLASDAATQQQQNHEGTSPSRKISVMSEASAKSSPSRKSSINRNEVYV